MSLKIDYPKNRKEKYVNKGVEKVAFLSKKRKKNNKNSINEKREEQVDFPDANYDEQNKKCRKNKGLEYRKSDEFKKQKSEKEAVRKQKEELAAQKRKIREEREEIFVRKLIAKKNKYRNRISKIERKFGKTQIEIYGENAVKALSAISKIAKVEKVAVGKQSTSIFVESKQCHKIIALLQNLCYDYKIINIGGVSPAIFRSLTRAGLIVGIVLVAVAVWIYSSFVTRVSVRCEGASDYALNAEISGILKEYGLKEGARLKSLDKSALEKAIMSLDGVAFASVSVNGTHVNVSYKTALKKEGFVQGNGKGVIASKRAVVTRVIAESGTAVKKYGDVVDVGDTLIEGYIEYGDSKIPVEARGYAFGKVYLKRTRFFANVESVEEVASCKKYTRYGMFGKTPKTPKSPFERYRLKTSVSDFSYLIPLKIYSYEFEEIREVERKNTLDDEQMKRAVYSDVVASLSESATVLDAYYEITKTEDGAYVTVTLEAEEII